MNLFNLQPEEINPVVVAPPGMSYMLARQLIDSPTYAQTWLREVGSESNNHNDPAREALYGGIRVHSTVEDIRAYRRGYDHGRKGKAPIFRETACGIVAEIDSDMADEWDDCMRRAYLDGYNAGV